MLVERSAFSHESRILDAACGTGDVLVGLHQIGFDCLAGIDASHSMLRQFAEAKPLQIHVQQRQWESIGQHFLEYGKYDFIYILGHSLPHLDPQSIPTFFKHVHEGLKEAGVFVFDIRQWFRGPSGELVQPNRPPNVYRLIGKAHLDNEVYSVEDRVSYEGNCQVVDYRLTGLAEISFTLDARLRYFLFEQDQVREWLLQAGFSRNDIGVEDP